MRILKNGRILMWAETAMTPESDVYVRFAGKKEVQTIRWDSDFVSGNTIEGQVNRKEIMPTPFTNSQNDTLTHISNAIMAANMNIERIKRKRENFII